MSSPSLRTRLKNLPPIDSPEYEAARHALLADDPSRPELRKLVDDKDDKVAFEALSAELSLLGRDWDLEEHRKLVASARSRFRNHPDYLGHFLILEAQSCRWSTNVRRLKRGLDSTRKAQEVLPVAPKALETFA